MCGQARLMSLLYVQQLAALQRATSLADTRCAVISHLSQLHDLCLVHARNQFAFLVIVEDDSARWRLQLTWMRRSDG